MKLLVVLLLSAFFVAVWADDEIIELPNPEGELELEPLDCPEGEVENECYGNCQPTCENLYVPCAMCERGCVCPEGQVRRVEGGDCVPEDQC